ncbi:hypothetical protein ACP9M8_16385 [Pseudomonas aeruginosa]|uniref:hypothetical protein n=1 Tax=Pseudomonas aeruginosa TaxID=287 RepID=UPI003CEF73C6
MSSTQLIEQCATRLRGIVEALDNIHDTSPQRWSTDLDDVHSSAESLLAMINDQAPARSEASFEEWLANELEGEDGQPVPAAVCDIALARRAFNHWPKLEQPAKVGGVRFSAGVSSRLVVEAAQRLYEFESTPEKEAERIERIQAFREQLDPLNLAPHAEAFNEAHDEALRPEQAEAERPEAVVYRYRCTNFNGEPLPGWSYSDDAGALGLREPLMTVAQHERIAGALRFERQQMDRAFTACINERDAALAEAERIKAISDNYYVLCVERQQQLDDALAKLAELEKPDTDYTQHPQIVGYARKKELEPLLDPCQPDGSHIYIGLDHPSLWAEEPPYEFLTPLYTAPVAQAQHSVPEGYALIPVRETEAMHDAVMALLYKGVARTDTQKLLDAYIAAAPGKEGV